MEGLGKTAEARERPWFRGLAVWSFAGGILLAGCTSFSPPRPPAADGLPSSADLSKEKQTVQQAVYQEPGTEKKNSADPWKSTPSSPVPPLDPPFAADGILSVDALVEQVLARNPSLAQMTAAWQAASTKYPQVTSLDDPMFGGTIGPATIVPPSPLETAYIVQLSQKLPYPGKLRLRGEVARFEADAAGLGIEDIRLQLIEAAKVAFYDYYLVDRALEVNREGLRLLGEFRKNAETRYKTGLVPQQDILLADVEIGRLQERDLTLGRIRQVARARINTLLHLPPDLPLPSPPEEAGGMENLPEVQSLRSTALAQRPDLRALADQIAAAEARVALAQKDFYPDFTPYASYNRFMGNRSPNFPLAYFLGAGVNLPVYRGRLNAALAEARANLARRRADYEKEIDRINFQVQEAYEKVLESCKVVNLYEKTILQAARDNIKSAQAAYVTGKIPFLSLIDAERDLVNLKDRYYQAVADFFSRQAVLERVVGAPPRPKQEPAPQPKLLPPESQ